MTGIASWNGIPVLNSSEVFISVDHRWDAFTVKPVHKFWMKVILPGAATSEYRTIQVTKLVDVFEFSVLAGEGTIAASEFTVSYSTTPNAERNRCEKYLRITFRGSTKMFLPSSQDKIMDVLDQPPRCFDVTRNGQHIVAADLNGKFAVCRMDRTSYIAESIIALEGHSLDVNACMFFPSQVVVLSGGMDFTVRVWAADTGVCHRILLGHKASVTGVGVVDVGKKVISCSNDGTAKIFQVADSKVLATIDFEAGKCVAMAQAVSRQRFAVICESNLLSIIDLNYIEHVRRDIKLPASPSCVCFSGDDPGHVVFVGFRDGHVVAVNVENNNIFAAIRIAKGSVTSLAIFQNYLLVATDYSTLDAYLMPQFPLPLVESQLPSISAKFQLTGPDVETIHAVVVRNSTVFASSDMVRVYKLKNVPISVL